jgi:hypothetical protein
MRRLSALLAVAAACLAAAESGIGQEQKAGPLAGAADRQLSERISTFYKTPDPKEVPGLLSQWSVSPSAQRREGIPPMVGFAAGLAAKYPDRIDAMFPPSLSPKAQAVAVAGVRIAGQGQKAQSLARSYGWPDDKVEAAGRGGNIREVRVASADDLDILWGASFAAGDAFYVHKILTFYAEFAKRPDVAVDDLVSIVKFVHGQRVHGQRQGGDLKWVVQKYGEARAREFVVAAAALWALDSNSRQHAFVRQLVDQFLAEQAGSLAAKGLLGLRS